jgi:protocatechuate 3,4-dioxygenase beta subunit
MSTRLPAAIVLTAAIGIGLAACGDASTASPAPSAAVATVPAASADPSATAGAPSTASTTGATDSAAVSCTAPEAATIAETEGPYYRPGAPERANLVSDGMAGTRLTLTGYVVTTDCSPVANAKVEIWQADSTGTYDNSGYTLRGYVLTDAGGRFTLLTIVPGEYPGRTEHIHVKVTPPGGSTLTTQVYFPGTAANDADGIYDPNLLLDIATSGDGLVGTYTFVVAA